VLLRVVADYGVGDLAFAPGSSGRPHGDGGNRVGYEIFARGRNAAALFGLPAAGTPVEVIS
jgi:hypothetical protein